MPIPQIGRRPQGERNASGLDYEVVIAEKQKVLSPGGKFEKIIVFSRVPQSRLEEDSSGKTLRAAKFAVSLVRERLEKTNLSAAEIKKVMGTMYAIDQKAMQNSQMKITKRALDAQALDVLLGKKLIKSGKVRFSEQTEVLPAAPVRQGPATSSVELPPLPDLPDA